MKKEHYVLLSYYDDLVQTANTFETLEEAIQAAKTEFDTFLEDPETLEDSALQIWYCGEEKFNWWGNAPEQFEHEAEFASEGANHFGYDFREVYSYILEHGGVEV